MRRYLDEVHDDGRQIQDTRGQEWRAPSSANRDTEQDQSHTDAYGGNRVHTYRSGHGERDRHKDEQPNCFEQAAYQNEKSTDAPIELHSGSMTARGNQSNHYAVPRRRAGPPLR